MPKLMSSKIYSLAPVTVLRQVANSESGAQNFFTTKYAVIKEFKKLVLFTLLM